MIKKNCDNVNNNNVIIILQNKKYIKSKIRFDRKVSKKFFSILQLQLTIIFIIN